MVFFNEGEHFTFSNSMIIDTVADKLYALVYNNDRFHTNLNLCSFDICTSNPQSKIVSDSIEYDFWILSLIVIYFFIKTRCCMLLLFRRRYRVRQF